MVVRHVAVATWRRAQFAFMFPERAAAGGLAPERLVQHLFRPNDARLIDPQASPFQADFRLLQIEAGRFVGIDGQQPVLERLAVAIGEMQTLDGQHPRHGHQHADQIRNAHRVAPFDPGQVFVVDESVIEQRSLEDFIDAPAALEHFRQRAERHCRREVARNTLVNARQQPRRVAHRADLQRGAQANRLVIEDENLVHIHSQRAAPMQPPRGFQTDCTRRFRALLDRLLDAAHFNANPKQSLDADFGNIRARRRSAWGGGQGKRAYFAIRRIKACCRFVDEVDPGVPDAGNVDHQLAQIADRHRAGRQDLRWRRKISAGIVSRAGQQVGQRELAPVTEVGERIAELLKDRDPWIVGVVIGPGVAGQMLDERYSLLAQRREIERRGIGCNRGECTGVSHGDVRSVGPARLHFQGCDILAGRLDLPEERLR
ncbi:MAG: hypothetical protein AW07_04266 [Candidatus Accumulibacter sp. SK-11]|nr:MAG: hypothetical protein AW07_04266 [Candidatus Accumulibacter sp. SK-11]